LSTGRPNPFRAASSRDGPGRCFYFAREFSPQHPFLECCNLFAADVEPAEDIFRFYQSLLSPPVAGRSRLSEVTKPIFEADLFGWTCCMSCHGSQSNNES